VTLLVLGGAGMLGRAFAGLGRSELRSLHREDFELGHSDPFELLERQRPQLVINCAAYTEVDKAEAEPERAHLVNAAAVGKLAEACQSVGSGLIHFSTDYVFDGSANVPYEPDAPKRPINVYGQTKSDGEDLALQSGVELLIVRTSWVFAPWGKNFVRTMGELLRTRPEVRVVADQVGCPTYAPDLAARALALYESNVRGVAHVTNGPPVSWYEFAVAIQEAQGSDAQIIPVPSADFPRPAPRPHYSVLSSTSGRGIGEALPDFRKHLPAALGL
jgi:dTDP-4-dehydrorhamnose reductase